MSASTITREQLLQLMTEQAGPDTASFVETVLERAGWGTKPTFTQLEFLDVMTGVSRFGRELMQGAGDAATQEHVGALFDVLDAHALPALRERAEA